MLHPDEYVYYNAFVGGTHGARGAVQARLLGQFLRRGGRRRWRTLCARNTAPISWTTISPSSACGPPVSAAYYFPPNFIFTPDRDNAQFVIAFTKDDCDKTVTGKEIYRVERMGTLLSLVLDRRAIGWRRTGMPPAAAARAERTPWNAANTSAWLLSRTADVVVPRPCTANLISAWLGARSAARRRRTPARCRLRHRRIPGAAGRAPGRARFGAGIDRDALACRFARGKRRHGRCRLDRRVAFRRRELRRRLQRRRAVPSAASSQRGARGKCAAASSPAASLVLNLPAYRWLYSAHDRAVDNVRRYGRAEVAAAPGRGGLRPTSGRAIGTPCSFP